MTELIGIVANEPSGDLLGVALMRSLRERLPDARFVGVGGPMMSAAGCESFVAFEQLSVMGLVEVVKALPRLLRARRRLVARLEGLTPRVVIGIDAPDFNLALERRLRRRGIKTVHLVSPTVWAWRPGRVRTILRSVDLMLSLFPFEVEFLEGHGVPTRYIGHPLADEIPMTVSREEARTKLGLIEHAEDTQGQHLTVIALLPGSRESEIDMLGRRMLAAAAYIHERRADVQFLGPMANAKLYRLFDELRRRHAPRVPVTLMLGRSQLAMAAANCVLTASGTATLEALLLKRPMVVAYRVHRVTYALVKTLRLVKVPFAAMANLLVGQELAPELIQENCTAERMGSAVLELLDDAPRCAAISRRYHEIHVMLRRDAARAAATAIAELMEREED